MRKIKGYTLTEVMLVMIIMIMVLALGLSAYTQFAETTRFNQDVATLQNDILILQRAAMLFEREPGENWVYGIGIDLQDVGRFDETHFGGDEYAFFKWVSEFSDYGDPKTTAEYPADGDTIPRFNDDRPDRLYKLSGYGNGHLTLGIDRITKAGSTNAQIRFILFEAVTGRTFFYNESLNRVDSDLYIDFNKRYGDNQRLVIKNLTGRTRLINRGDAE